MTQVNEQMPPHDLEAERAVLGACIIDPEAVDTALERLRVDQFYHTGHGMIYQAILDLWEEASEKIDLITVCNMLQQQQRLEKVGGPDYVVGLATDIGTSANLAHHAEIVAEHARKRDLINVGQELAEKAQRMDVASEELVTMADAQLLAAVQGQGPSGGFAPMSEVLSEVEERLRARQASGSKLAGFDTGFDKLNELLSGFRPGHLYLLAGRPSEGKTSLALQFAWQVAIRNDIPVGVFSLEMGQDEIGDRMIASKGRVSTTDISSAQVDLDGENFKEAMGLLEDLSIYVDDSSTLTIMEAKSRARRLQGRAGLGMLVVDYLQLMSANADTREQEIARISRGLKALAKDLHVPILACAQLSRAVEQHTDRKPQLSDLRESGSLEQDSNVVMFIHHPPESVRQQNPKLENAVELIVAKNRNGPKDSLMLRWQAHTTSFAQMDFHSEPPPPINGRRKDEKWLAGDDYEPMHDNR